MRNADHPAAIPHSALPHWNYSALRIMDIVTFDLDTGHAVTLSGGLDLSEALGAAVRTRASHILPANKWKRAAFRLIRSAFRNPHSAFHQWTRTWRGPWQVWVPLADCARHTRFLPLYEHASRGVCLKWERAYFNEQALRN